MADQLVSLLGDTLIWFRRIDAGGRGATFGYIAAAAERASTKDAG